MTIVGKRFGRLKVVAHAGHDTGSNPLVRVRCDCGVEKVLRKYSVASGNAKSCGCYRKETVAAHNTNEARSRVPSRFPVELVKVPLVRKGPRPAAPPPTRSMVDQAVDHMRERDTTSRKAADLFGVKPQDVIARYNARFGTRRQLVG
jgi:hypothetical protein